MTEKKRLANFELLRVLAMIMVVIMHFLSHSGSLIELTVPLTGIRILGSVLENLCLAGVNVYVFISGYFGVTSNYKPSRVLSLLGQIWFYALLIPLVLAFAGVPTAGETMGIYGVIQYILPIETEHYWFATSYLMLYLLSPVLNKAVKGMTRRQFQIVLAGLLILFSFIKSISPVVLAVDNYGYDLPWFICVYLIAAYLRTYGNAFLEKRGWLVYGCSALIGFGIQLSMWFLTGISDSFSYYFSVPYHYNFIFCLTGAIGLFYGFSKIRMKEGKGAQCIRTLGGLCLGVYLLHEHVDVRSLWYGWLKGWVNPGARGGMAFFLLELIASIVILFTAGIVIDWMRSLLFQGVRKCFAGTRMGKKLHELDESFLEEMK